MCYWMKLLALTDSVHDQEISTGEAVSSKIYKIMNVEGFAVAFPNKDSSVITTMKSPVCRK